MTSAAFEPSVSPVHPVPGELGRSGAEDGSQATVDIVPMGLLGLLELDACADGPDGEGLAFRGRPPHERSFPVYGGHIVAQALAAAGRTVPDDHHAHSLHAYYLCPVRPDACVTYRVYRVTDTRTCTARRVSAWQNGAEVLTVSASFRRPEPGAAHQEPMPHMPDPESLPTFEERLTAALGQIVEPLGKPYDLRFVGPLSIEAAADPALCTPCTRIWLRADARVPPEEASAAGREQLTHACLLAYLSDATLVETMLTRLGLSALTDVRGARSLDHALWFHRPFRADEWLLYDQTAPVSFGGRGLAHGRFFTREGLLVASAAQEARLPVSARPDSSG